MYTIVKDSIAEGHEAVVRLIMGGNEFLDVTTEDKELTFEYPEPVNIHVRKPHMPPFASPYLMFGSQSLDTYKEEIMSPRVLADRPGLPDFSYLYSNLIWDFPKGTPFNVFAPDTKKFTRVDWPVGNGREGGTNQINYVVKKLVSSPASRRCVVSLFHPEGHPRMDDPPCLNHIQFLLRNGELNCHALFRSNDMLSAWGANAFALSYLQQDVVKRVKEASGSQISCGFLETTSISAHIYWKRDKSELDEFRKRWK